MRQAPVTGKNLHVLLGGELVDRKAATHVGKRNDDVNDDRDNIKQEYEDDGWPKEYQQIRTLPPLRRPKPIMYVQSVLGNRGHVSHQSRLHSISTERSEATNEG